MEDLLRRNRGGQVENARLRPERTCENGEEHAARHVKMAVERNVL